MQLTEAYCRYVEQLGLTLQGLGWHAQAVTLCHLEGLLAGAVLSSPALLAASHAKLVCLAEALNLQSLADRARQQAGMQFSHDGCSRRLSAIDQCC